MIKLEIEALDATHLRKQLAEILGGAPTAPLVQGLQAYTQGGDANTQPPKTVRKPKTTETPAAATPTDEPQTTEVGPADAEVEASESTDEPHALTYDGDIKPAVLKVSAHPEDRGGGREGVLKLCAKFDVPHINKIPEEKWPELLDAINLVLEG